MKAVFQVSSRYASCYNEIVDCIFQNMIRRISTFASKCLVVVAISSASAFAAPLNLVITYDTVFGVDQVATALTNHGQEVVIILKAGPGDLAKELSGNQSFTNVFLWDIGAGSEESTPVINGTDLSALISWYSGHNNIVIDGRSYGAYFSGILGDEGIYLNNVANTLSARGGGLWVGADHKGQYPPPISDWTLNANSALSALMFNPITGEVGSKTFLVDSTNPIMSNVSGPSLLWGWSAGVVPIDIQPNGTKLCKIGWDENNTPLISTNLCNSVPVPAPLPILGVGAALGFIRKLRKISSRR